MRELEEALMDRTTASMNRRARVTSIHATTLAMMDMGSSKPRKYSSPDYQHIPQTESPLMLESGSSGNERSSNNSSCRATKVLEHGL